LILHCKIAADVWSTLEQNFKYVPSVSRQHDTFEELFHLKYQPGKTIEEHIAAFNALYLKIQTFPYFKGIPEALWVNRFLWSLPPEYSGFARAFDRTFETMTLIDVYHCLRREPNYRRSWNAGEQTPAVNIASTGSNSKRPKPKKHTKR